MSRTSSTAPRRGTDRCALTPKVMAALALVAASAFAFDASAQSLRITNLWVSDDAYSDGQDFFDPDAPVAVFMSFEAAGGGDDEVTFSASCDITRATSGERLRTIEFGPLEVAPDDYVGTHWLTMSWPEEEVSVTCVPNGDARGARTHVVAPRFIDRGSSASLRLAEPPDDAETGRDVADAAPPPGAAD